MITVKCQHTGIEFEAKSSRTKMHPAIAAIKNEAAKRGNYRQVLEALEAAGKRNWTSIEEAIAFINEVAEGKIAKNTEKINARLREEAAQEAAKRDRVKTNRFLKSHGYRWSREDEESMDVFGATAFETTYGTHASAVWELTAPDGRIVTVEQALEEIRNK